VNEQDFVDQADFAQQHGAHESVEVGSGDKSILGLSHGFSA
jgi:hypothetical protein